MRCSGHVQLGGGPEADTEHAGEISRLARACPPDPPDKLEEVAGDSKVWTSVLRLLPLQPSSEKAEENVLFDGKY